MAKPRAAPPSRRALILLEPNAFAVTSLRSILEKNAGQRSVRVGRSLTLDQLAVSGRQAASRNSFALNFFQLMTPSYKICSKYKYGRHDSKTPPSPPGGGGSRGQYSEVGRALLKSQRIWQV